MKLKVILPSKILLHTEVGKVIIEGEEGSRGILPNHIDVAVSITPGIMSYFESGSEKFIAHDEGMFIKQGDELRFSTRQAVKGNKLGELKKVLRDEIESLSEIEKKSRSAVTMLESNLIEKFREQKKNT